MNYSEITEQDIVNKVWERLNDWDGDIFNDTGKEDFYYLCRHFNLKFPGE